MANNWRVIGRIARDPQLRRIQLGFACFAVAEHATWLTGLLYAFDRGGVGEAGLVAVILLLPTIVVAPVGAAAADRFDGGRVLAFGYATQSASMLLAAVAIAADIGSVPVYAAAMIAASSITLTRPAIGAVLPRATHVPADLTAANVVTGFVEYSGMFVGPALAGVLTNAFGLASPFAVCAGSTAIAAGLALRLRLDTADDDTADTASSPDGDDAHAADGVTATSTVAAVDRGHGDPTGPTASPVGDAMRDTLDGLVALRDQPSIRMLIVVLGIGALVMGAADVLFVAIADHLNDGNTSQAGLLGTAFGVGAMLGSILTVLLVGRARLTPWVAAAVAVAGFALAALAAAETMVIALLLCVVMGGGESVLRVSASTLIQRVSPADVVGRFFGVSEAVRMFLIAIGSGAVGLLIGQLGYRPGLAVAGAGVVALLLFRLRGLLRIDRDAVVPEPRVLELILADDIFASLPAPTVERLAADAERQFVMSGDVVIQEGDDGDRYFVIDSGVAQVTVGGRETRTLTSGQGFGEIALIRDVPRTATVRATTDLELLAFERERFLQAVTGHARSSAIGRSRADRYLDLEHD